MIHLYTGEGKGKTTAAVGLAVRAAGNGMKVIFAQFMKGGETGELEILKKIPNVRLYRSDRDFGFFYQMTEGEKGELRREHNWILGEIRAQIRAGNCDLAVLDEVTYAMNWELLDMDLLEEILQSPDTELVLTGRDPAQTLMNRADYITNMQEIRHPYRKGVPARKGIEY